MSFQSKLNEIFNSSLGTLHETIRISLEGAIEKLQDPEIMELWKKMVEPLKDQELWDHLVYSLNTLGVLSVNGFREINQLRRRWLEIEEVWDQIIPQNSPEEIFKLGMSVLQNCPKERAWVKLLYVLEECKE